MFNLGSSYFHVALTTVRHLLIVCFAISVNKATQLSDSRRRERAPCTRLETGQSSSARSVARQLNATNSISVKCLSDRTVDRSGNYAANARNGGAAARTHAQSCSSPVQPNLGRRAHA